MIGRSWSTLSFESCYRISIKMVCASERLRLASSTTELIWRSECRINFFFFLAHRFEMKVLCTWILLIVAAFVNVKVYATICQGGKLTYYADGSETMGNYQDLLSCEEIDAETVEIYVGGLEDGNWIQPPPLNWTTVARFGWRHASRRSP